MNSKELLSALKGLDPHYEWEYSKVHEDADTGNRYTQIGLKGYIREDDWFYEGLIAEFFDEEYDCQAHAKLVCLLVNNIGTIIEALEQMEPVKSDAERVVELLMKAFPEAKYYINGQELKK